MDALLKDIRYAVRGLARSPGFTAAALVSLALGIGANATVFSFVNALLLRPAPAVRDASSLVAAYTSDFSSGPYGTTSYPDFISLKTDASAFSGLAAYGTSAALFRDGETTERLRLMTVSGDFFALLGLQPAVGRLIAQSDTTGGGAPVAVIGHDLWRRAFASDPAVVGRSVFVDGQPRIVVGVAPPRFDGLSFQAKFELWTPLVGRADDPRERGSRGLSVVGRLRDGVTMTVAQSQLDAIAASLARAFPPTNMGTLRHPNEPRPMVVVRHTRIDPEFRGMVAMIGAVLMAAVGLVLLVTCANVAGLLLSRAAARAREITIRLALGASRPRILASLLAESILLGIGGGALGVLFSLWTADVLPSFFPAEQAQLLDANVDARVVGFVAVISVAAGALFGLAPALQAIRPGARAVLYSGGSRLSDSRTSLLRTGLVFAQVALTFMLLVSSGLLVRSLSNARQADLGFRTREAVLATIEIPSSELTPEQGTIYYGTALERVGALPGVEAASLAQTPPLSGGPRRRFRMEGYEPRAGEDTELHFNVIDDAYFGAMRIPLIAGRSFDARDSTGPRVVIVNDLFSQRYFGGRAVGRTVVDSRGTSEEIVGVVGSGKLRGVQEPPVPVVFYPLSQVFATRVTLVARTSGDPTAYAEPIRNTLKGIHRSVSVFRVMTLSDHLAEALAAERLTAALVGAAGSMALALALVGVYGVIAYGVVRRRKEIGVRIALGAQPFDVVRLVVYEGLRVTLIGIAAGVGAALGATQLLGSMLYGIGPRDATTFAATAVALVCVAALAAWAPAQRAVRLDPVSVLRQE